MSLKLTRKFMITNRNLVSHKVTMKGKWNNIICHWKISIYKGKSSRLVLFNKNLKNNLCKGPNLKKWSQVFNKYLLQIMKQSLTLDTSNIKILQLEKVSQEILKNQMFQWVEKSSNRNFQFQIVAKDKLQSKIIRHNNLQVLQKEFIEQALYLTTFKHFYKIPPLLTSMKSFIDNFLRN